MNWDDFFKLKEMLKDVQDKDVQKQIEKGKGTLRKEHDELEKPLKEAEIILGKDKKHSKKKDETSCAYWETPVSGLETLSLPNQLHTGSSNHKGNKCPILSFLRRDRKDLFFQRFR